MAFLINVIFCQDGNSSKFNFYTTIFNYSNYWICSTPQVIHYMSIISKDWSTSMNNTCVQAKTGLHTQKNRHKAQLHTLPLCHLLLQIQRCLLKVAMIDTKPATAATTFILMGGHSLSWAESNPTRLLWLLWLLLQLLKCVNAHAAPDIRLFWPTSVFSSYYYSSPTFFYLPLSFRLDVGRKVKATKCEEFGKQLKRLRMFLENQIKVMLCLCGVVCLHRKWW